MSERIPILPEALLALIRHGENHQIEYEEDRSRRGYGPPRYGSQYRIRDYSPSVWAGSPLEGAPSK